MNSKNILLVLISLLIFVNLYLPISRQNHKLHKKIEVTEKAIEKDRLYINHKQKILDDINRSKSINAHFAARHFYTRKESQIFNIMQKTVRQKIELTQVTEDNIRWGEPTDADDFKEFPMTVRVYGSIVSLGNFFDSIQKVQKLHLRNFIISRTNKFFLLEVNLFGLKRQK